MAIDPRVDIGHVHLKVSDLDRALAFYVDVLGFELQHRYGEEAAFISAGGYHHHIGLNTWDSKGGGPPPRNTTGLYHTAIRYPDRETLADAPRRATRPASTTPRSAIRIGRRSPTRSAACSTPASRSGAPATTASARRST